MELSDTTGRRSTSSSTSSDVGHAFTSSAEHTPTQPQPQSQPQPQPQPQTRTQTPPEGQQQPAGWAGSWLGSWLGGGAAPSEPQTSSPDAHASPDTTTTTTTTVSNTNVHSNDNNNGSTNTSLQGASSDADEYDDANEPGSTPRPTNLSELMAQTSDSECGDAESRERAISYASDEPVDESGGRATPPPTPLRSPHSPVVRILRDDDDGGDASDDSEIERAAEAALWAQAHAAFASTHEPRRLVGEVTSVSIAGVEMVPYTGSSTGAKLVGKLHLTNANIKFSLRSAPPNEPAYFCMPLGAVETVTAGAPAGVVVPPDKDPAYITCKDGRVAVFSFSNRRKSRNAIVEKLRELAFPGALEEVFAFSFKEQYRINGWKVYNPRAELARMGVPNDYWRIEDEANANFEMCRSYPRTFAVPATFDTESVMAVAAFRSRGRIPILSWLHPDNHAALLRSSQPMVGVMYARSAEDEAFMGHVIAARPQPPEPNDDGTAAAGGGGVAEAAVIDRPPSRLLILDARPKANAIANVGKGLGYEYAGTYVNCDIEFLDIQNIHYMRDSLSALRGLLSSAVPVDGLRWHSLLEKTGWLEHLFYVLSGAVRATRALESGRCVLVHCSDGWDRTAQLTSLAKLMVDPYYRTLHGFAVLVETEWVGDGFRFATRCGHASSNARDSQRSPIFLQFLDAVWQMTCQFPSSFEFNESFLLELAAASTSCVFGTFVFDCEADRVGCKVETRTVSVWSHILSNAELYTNRLYVETAQRVGSAPLQTHVLIPNPSAAVLSVWYACHARPLGSTATSPNCAPPSSLESAAAAVAVEPMAHLANLAYRALGERDRLAAQVAALSAKLAELGVDPDPITGSVGVGGGNVVACGGTAERRAAGLEDDIQSVESVDSSDYGEGVGGGGSGGGSGGGGGRGRVEVEVAAAVTSASSLGVSGTPVGGVGMGSDSSVVGRDSPCPTTDEGYASPLSSPTTPHSGGFASPASVYGTPLGPPPITSPDERADQRESGDDGDTEKIGSHERSNGSAAVATHAVGDGRERRDSRTALVETILAEHGAR